MNMSTIYRQLSPSGGARLLSDVGANPKIVKSDKSGKGYLTRIMHLAPADLSGYEVCPSRSPQCSAMCLHTSGARFMLPQKERGRIAKTKFLFEHPDLFLILLKHEIQQHVDFCAANNAIPAIRLNGTSDIVWERKFPSLFTDFPNVVFYDYTKIAKRLDPAWGLPSNYSLTFSRSETARNQRETAQVLAWGGKVCVVFGDCGYGRFQKPLPTHYNGYPVFDGDKSDLRFLDPKGYIIGVRAKGKAYGQGSKPTDFVVRLNVIQISPQENYQGQCFAA